jgi:hypothetical protein
MIGKGEKNGGRVWKEGRKEGREEIKKGIE